MTKETRFGVLTRRSSRGFAFSKDGCKNQGQLLGFRPKSPSLFLLGRDSGGEHPQPVLGFLRLTTAHADAVSKLLIGSRLIGLAVVRADTGCRPNQLPDQRSRDDIQFQLPREPDRRFTEFRSPLDQIVSSPRFPGRT